MKKDIKTELDRIEKRIRANNLGLAPHAPKEWGGADVKIKDRMDEETREWLEDQPIVVSSDEWNAQRRAVITRFSKELGWLIEELKRIFAGKIDFISKYPFYGTLAQAANDYLEEHKNDINPEGLLLAVLKAARAAFKISKK